MKFYTDAELAVILDKKHIFRQISQVIDSLGVDGYVVGGYVRDIFLERPSNDIDVVIVSANPTHQGCHGIIITAGQEGSFVSLS